MISNSLLYKPKEITVMDKTGKEDLRNSALCRVILAVTDSSAHSPCITLVVTPGEDNVPEALSAER